nr:PREDICTED: DNA-directed RNA polymerase, mitochondrial [Linepithema humile]
MFNFLRTRLTSMQNARIVSARPTVQCSMRFCSFCKFYHLKPLKPLRHTQLRHYATTDVEVELQAPWKQIKRRSKKPEEPCQKNNRKAAVHKLNFAHISALVDQPDTNKLHDIAHLDKGATTTQANNAKTEFSKDLVYTEDHLDNTYNMILKESEEYVEDKSTVIENLKECGISDNTTLIKDSTFLDILQRNKENDLKDEPSLAHASKCNKSSNESFYATIPFTKQKDIFEDSLTDQNLILQVLAYVDIYIQNKMLTKVSKILMKNSDLLKRTNIPTPYNMFMEFYVSNRNMPKVFEIHQIMKENSITPDAQTYALMFQVIVRMKHKESQEEKMADVVADMNRNDVSFDKIMNTVLMKVNQRDDVLRCIQLVDPEYRVRYKNINTSHSCKLLQNLTAVKNYQCPAKGVITNTNELRDMVRTQLEMEKRCTMEVKSITQFTGDPNVRQQAVGQIAEWTKTWKLVVKEAFERNLTYLKQKEISKQDLKFLYPFLEVLPKEEYINAILREINQLARSSDVYSLPMLNLYTTLGKYIYTKYQFHCKMKAGIIENVIQVYDKYLEWYLQKDSTDSSVNGRSKWQQLVHEMNKSGLHSQMMVPEWPRHVLVNIGKFLYNIIINDVKIPHVFKAGAPERLIPAFYLLYRNKTKIYLTEEIKPHPHLYKVYKESHPETLTFDTILLPMCSPPRPWIDINTGGYLISKAEFVRDPYMTPTYLLSKTPTKQLYPAFDCLNQLGTIPWQINKPILDILIEIFQNGGSEKLEVPQPPSALPSLKDLISREGGKVDNSKISHLLVQLKRRKNEMYSLWCDCLYKLSLANHFRDKVFWLPHNLDFRGRVYPVPPHMTHLTSDLGRSILMFAQGKPLGPNGLDWLKIHTINLTGMKKREPIHKRLEFANEILDLIIDSARNPLTGEMWWTKSDEPWQTLAACKEIDYALQSPDVERYVSSLPIHQDGSCNGLQHYAALGRDQIGAESVNLCPMDTPQDVYSVVASYVDNYRRIDANADVKVAKVLEGHISRKVIKQTVMTTVYGVTKFGARLQIARQLSDLKEFDHNYVWSGSQYLTEKTFKSLQTMFASAKEIQDWFTQCAGVISLNNQYVQWVTPLGLPVLQPYFRRIKSTSQKKLGKTSNIKPDTMKQKNAFPPNFIHSLDSSHMMLTSLHCEQAGITFMSVHDCFWTHPCTVDIMNRICREQFVMLHNEPILEDLSKFFCEKYKDHFTLKHPIQRNQAVGMHVFKNLPKKGDFDINGILSSRYFFS